MHTLPSLRLARRAITRTLLIAGVVTSGLFGALTATVVAPETAVAAIVCPPPTGDSPPPTPAPAGTPARCEIYANTSVPGFPTCNHPYTLIANSNTCLAEPIDDSQPPPKPPDPQQPDPQNPPDPTQPDPTCDAIGDTYDKTLGLCVHPGNPGLPQPCRFPYRQVNGFYCGTEPGNSRTPPGDGQDVNTPQCAVAGYGPIACPIEPIILPDGGCYVQNPYAPKPADRGWRRAVCSDAAFTPPQAIDCASNPTIAQYCDQATRCTGTQCDLVAKYVNPLIRLFSAMVALGVTISIVWAGIQYSRSADDSRAVSAAKRRIFYSLLTLVGYFLFYQFLRWIVPGNGF